MKEEINWQDWVTPLNIPAGKSGTAEIIRTTEAPGYELATSNARSAFLGGHKIRKIKFPVETTWHKLVNHDGTWMQDIPIEMITQGKDLEGVHGHILVGGLGLGWAATKLCLDPFVDSVTVVEKDSDVIKLVEPHLLRGEGQEAAREKLRVIDNDLFQFLDDARKEGLAFDFAIYDIWRSDSESTFFSTVIPLRQLSLNVATEVRNWNEHQMRMQLRNSLQWSWSRINYLPPEIDWEEAVKINTTVVKSDGLSDFFDNWKVPFMIWLKQYDLLRIEELGEEVIDDVQNLMEIYVQYWGTGPSWLHDWALKLKFYGYPIDFSNEVFETMDRLMSVDIEKLLKGDEDGEALEPLVTACSISDEIPDTVREW